MKIESANTKPTFIPVTITLESAQELAFYRDVLGRTTDALARSYGISRETFSEAYTAINEQCESQRAAAYMSSGYDINFERKEQK